jgi:hypothetical protein
VAKQNYSFEKRQRELAKKKKQDEKQQEKNQRKASKGPAQDEETGQPSLIAPAPADTGGEAGNT